MILFHCDLDNTLIYSYKHEIKTKKRCVEIYQGREVSFMTEATCRLLNKVKNKRTENKYFAVSCKMKLELWI